MAPHRIAPFLPPRTAALSLVLVAVGLLASCSDAPTDPGQEMATVPAPEMSVSLAQTDDYVPGQVIVKFKRGANAQGIMGGVGAQVEREMSLGMLLLKVPDQAVEAVVAALSRNPNVEFAEPNYIRTFGNPAVMPVNDPYIGYKWDLDNDGTLYTSTGGVVTSTGSADADMDWREAVEYLGTVSGSAKIGIMDTGIRADHEELTGRVAAQYDFFAGDADAADDNGHGTHVAGITAAAANNGTGVAGVAFAGNIRFVIAKVCGESGRGPFKSYGCPLDAIADGIVWAVDNGANVLNLSLGGSTGSDAERSALQYARSMNVLPFCATGNDNGSVSYPAKFPECVAVGATDWSDNRASYSNYGPEIELSAPGGDDEDPNGYSYILSSYFDSPTAYAFMAGTSMATPQATGLGALLHVLGVADDDAKLANMKSTADDLGESGWDQYFGEGRINVNAAVSAASGETTNNPPTASFTFSCADLACTFNGTGSGDSDGSISSYEWVFGDGATGTGITTTHTYASGGTYTVTLTVTDDGSATDSDSHEVTVTKPSSGGIELSLTAYKVRGTQNADLTWNGASSTNVDIYRNGTVVATTENDGAHTDTTGNKGGGSAVYKVCEAGTDTCSPEVTAIW